MDMTETILTAFLILIPILIVVFLFWVHFNTRKIAYKWAINNNYNLIKLRYTWFWRPFYAYGTKAQKVFRGKIKMEDGKIEKVYIKCGNWYRGIIKDDVEVLWDKDRNKKLP